MEIQTITPQQASELCQQGAVLIDIREADEYAREHIAHAQLLPLSAIEQGQCVAGLCREDTVIFHCQSGIRSNNNADKLRQAALSANVLLMEGGLAGWRGQGLAVVRDKSQPLPVMRQVQIVAGLLVLCTVILGYTVTPVFLLIAGLVGAGLLFAGISGYCGMAKLLQVMPWNQRPH